MEETAHNDSMPTPTLPKQDKTIQVPLQDNYIPVRARIQQKIHKIFREFTFASFTFHLFLLNCLIWFSVHLVYYWGGIQEWDCVQLAFFAKFQPSITYNHQFWRLILSSLMFRGWVQFYFNNFALNMLGYIIEKQSRARFLMTFYGGILAGHMLSCCIGSPSQLTVGTSCGTIALLPTELYRYLNLRRTNPIQARSRLNFLLFNILSNFILNILAIFHLDSVDWVSHVGCLIAGVLFLCFWETKLIKYAAVFLLIGGFLCMGLIIWVYLPHHGVGMEELKKINFMCYSGI